MPIHHFTFTEQIAGSPEAIFDLVADMPNYGRWLPNSAAFGGTVSVEPYPVRLGTTYLDAGPIEKPGMVTEFEPPKHISFRHTVQIRSGPLKTDLDAQIRYTFEPKDGGTFIIRELDLIVSLTGLFNLASPYLLWAFRKENMRTLSELKRYVEARAQN
jgi:uncharacterized protein YndB with AHSA1/START domain